MLKSSAVFFSLESTMIDDVEPCLYPFKSTLSVRFCSPRISVRRMSLSCWIRASFTGPLEKSSAEFGVGIGNEAARARERERELEAVGRLTGIRTQDFFAWSLDSVSQHRRSCSGAKRPRHRSLTLLLRLLTFCLGPAQSRSVTFFHSFL